MGGGTRRSGSFAGSDVVTNVVSSRLSETGGLGVKMVEYVLGTSPPGKDLESRMRGIVLVFYFFNTSFSIFIVIYYEISESIR